MQKLDENNYAKLNSEGLMPLVIEMFEEKIETIYGNAKCISVAHYYKQNGDLMSDPQMNFIVIDKRSDPNDLESIVIYPLRYRQDNLGIDEESMLIINNKIASFNKYIQYAHCNFAS
ncbi:MAG TPA: hypothetical protein VHZ50_08795, partial [Puia sp.]|nr:hypothetical protein [Puia sp.]